jgi:hypothetical protein
MKKLYEVFTRKDEKFEIEFFEDKECTKPCDFNGKENLYLQLKDGDCTPVFALENKMFGLDKKANIFSPIWYLGFRDGLKSLITLNDITPNLSKYIPEDNAVLFLSVEDWKEYESCFLNNDIVITGESNRLLGMNRANKHTYFTEFLIIQAKKLTIFLPHGTQTELQKANEVAKELKEKYDVKEVNLLTPDCFLHDSNSIDIYQYDSHTCIVNPPPMVGNCYLGYCGLQKLVITKQMSRCSFTGRDEGFFLHSLSWQSYNDTCKLITTNSTGILEPQKSERLEVIDCKEIFEEYLNKN